MKKIIVLLLFAVCFPSQSFSEGIFGLKKGMSVDEIRTLDFGDIKQSSDNINVYSIYKPKKPKDVTQMQLLVTPEKGLLQIIFIWSIQTNVYGDSVRQKFDELHDILTKKYGKGKKYDYLKHGSIWNRPQDWMMGLLKKDRRLIWVSDITGSNKQALIRVSLNVTALRRETAFLDLRYEFQGFREYLNKKKAEEASQF